MYERQMILPEIGEEGQRRIRGKPGHRDRGRRAGISRGIVSLVCRRGKAEDHRWRQGFSV